ncbi:MAG: lipoyl(octanoyl) transferase LipB [Gammaproteobacteria bacterium]|nr:lipoyl(octanoyl) transferase LipB [Gammaproteobacteria bacterium]
MTRPAAGRLRELVLRDLGRTDYATTYAAMSSFTDARDARTRDELWLTEHEPVFTQGQAGRDEHVLAPGAIPVIRTDRGGQVTYHGPGQVVAYVLFDVRRLELGVRDLVTGIEAAMIATLAAFGIEAEARPDARGVYVGGAKIGALGLRIRRGRSYHGLALNVAMDLEPFGRIDPCGLRGITVTQVTDRGGPADIDLVRERLVGDLARAFGFDGVSRACRTSDSGGFWAA